MMRLLNSLADKFALTAICLYTATFILWYVYEGRELSAGREGVLHPDQLDAVADGELVGLRLYRNVRCRK